MPNSTDMSPMDMDALREISNIGMGNALTSLSQLVNRKVNMSVPQAGFYPIDKVIALVGGQEKLVSCVSLRVLGDLQGTVLFVFDEESTYTLVNLLMGQPRGTIDILDEMGESAVKEIGNVLTSSFLNAISMMSQMNMVPTVPVFAFDMLGAILTSVMIASGRMEEKVLVIENELFQENQKVTGHFFFLAEPESISELLAALGLS